MEEEKSDLGVADQPDVKPKAKLHIWNQILEEDELSEKLAASMNKLGDQLTRRFIKRRGKKNKNKKKKKGKTDPNVINNPTSENKQINGVPSQSQTLKPQVKNPTLGQSKPRPPEQPDNKPNRRRRRGGSNKKNKLPNHILQVEAGNISRKLNEKRYDLIVRTINHLGLDEAMKLCSEVLTIEEAGGLMTLNGIRRRTPGGIFFHLIRSSGRYEASVVAKIFKEGDNKEPVFKKRIKTPKSSTKPNDGPSSSVTPDNTQRPECVPATPVQPNQVVSPFLFVPHVASMIPIISVMSSTLPTTVPITSAPQLGPLDQQIPSSNPMNPTQSINQGDPGISTCDGVNQDNSMSDDDEMENSNLVIVEYDSSEMDKGNLDRNAEQLIKCTFPNSQDLNILRQPSPSLSEKPSAINSNVSMFSSNRISVDA